MDMDNAEQAMSHGAYQRGTFAKAAPSTPVQFAKQASKTDNMRLQAKIDLAAKEVQGLKAAVEDAEQDKVAAEIVKAYDELGADL